MEESFYRERLERQGIRVLVPAKEDRKTARRVIYDELFLGKVSDHSRQEYIRIIDDLKATGADGGI